MMKFASILAIIATFAGARIATGQTFMKEELQNEHVRVLRFRLAPHERIPMHEVPPHLAIWLTDADLKLSYPDGQSDIKHFRAGEARWVSIGKHSGENIGSRPLEFLAIEVGSPSASK